jgi:hypothetical protein
MNLNLTTYHADGISVLFVIIGIIPVAAFMLMMLGAVILGFISERFGGGSSSSTSDDSLDLSGKIFVGVFCTAFFVLLGTGIAGYSMHTEPIKSTIRGENANVLIQQAANTYGATLTVAEANKLLQGDVKDFDSSQRKYGTVNLSTPVDGNVVGIRLLHEGGKWLIYNTGTQKELPKISS